MHPELEDEVDGIVEGEITKIGMASLHELMGTRKEICGCKTCQRQARENLEWVKGWTTVAQIAETQPVHRKTSNVRRKK